MTEVSNSSSQETKTASPTNKDSIVTPAGAGIKIDNVSQSLWQYVKKRKLIELLAFVPLVIVWEVLAVVLLVKVLGSENNSSNSGTGKGFGYIIGLPFILFFGWLARLRKQFEDAFLEEFALAKQYTFDKNGTIDETYGTIFRLTGRQQVSDVVTGKYGDNSLRLFLYELTVGSGQYQHKYQDTVIELDLHGQLPNLLMVNKHSKYGQLGIAGEFGIKNTLQLEGDFNQYFTLYAPKGNEIEALEVFSPDTMALMEDASKHYSVEFAGNRIYIYSSGFITTTEQLTQVFGLAKKLIDKIGSLASRLQNDSAIVATPVNLFNKRKHSLLSNKFGLAFVIIVTVAGIAIVVFAIINAP